MDKDSIASWLRDGMRLRDVTQEKMGEVLSLQQNQISKMVRGVRDITAIEAAKAARFLNIPMPGEINTLEVMGYVGAGAEVIPINDGDPLSTVEVDFPVPRGSVAAIVRGDSMYPIFEDGDLVAYGGDHLPPERALGSTCVVQLADGRMLIKKIRRGTQPGLFTLTSSNAPDIEDVPLEWARAFVLRLSRDFWRKLR